MKRILIVVDMQNDFVTGALGSKEAEGIVGNVIEKIGEYDGAEDTVIFTADTHDSSYRGTQEGRLLPVEHCMRSTEGWKLADGITPPRGSLFFEKDTFGSRDLAVYLRGTYGAGGEDSGLASVELAGLCTDICVISNAMLVKAFLPEVPLYVDSRCCAGTSPEGHETALKAMKACQIIVK